MSIFSEAIQNVREIKSGDSTDNFVAKMSRTAKGSFAGLIGGLMVGWYFKKNLYVSAMIGTLAGGAINYYINEKK